MIEGQPPTPPSANNGGKPAGGAVASCPPDPCGKDAISNVTQCCGSEIYAAAKTANGGKDPTIVMGKPSQGFAAETNTQTGTITVDSKSDKCIATESVYFELANLAAKPKFDQVNSDANAGKLSREQFAQANEHIEYDNTKLAEAATDKCKKKWGCETHAFDFDGFRPAKDFNDYYDHYLADSHKNVYRNFWDTNIKSIYDAAHTPKH